MANVKKGLGRGLDALFESYKEEADQIYDDKTRVQEIAITNIDSNPNQARSKFDDEKIKELADSIRIHGVVQPIIVTSKGKRFQIVAGERRWRASRLANKDTIPSIIVEIDEQQTIEIGLIENLQREDLNPIEEAKGVKALVDRLNLTQEEAAKRLGKSRPAVANALRLLQLSKKVQKLLSEDRLSAGHARALLVLSDDVLRETIAKTIIEKELSVRETEKLIQGLNKKVKNTKTKEKPNYIIEIESELEESLGTKVQIKPGAKKGIIEIEYYSNEDLERIMERVNKQ